MATVEPVDRPMPVVPTVDVDLFCDQRSPSPIRTTAGCATSAPSCGSTVSAYALPRYAEVRDVLGRPAEFCSGQGVGLNDVINEAGRGSTLMSDGDAHHRQREVIGRPLTPRALAGLRAEAQALADALVDRLVARGSFDAVANFDALGPRNARAEASWDRLLEMVDYARGVAGRDDLPPGCTAAGVLAAAERGDIEPDQCPMLLIDYLAPSLDTTISALGSAVWLFGTHPDQWDLLRREPHRVKAAFNEVVRFESPISCFTRVATIRRLNNLIRALGSLRVTVHPA